MEKTSGFQKGPNNFGFPSHEVPPWKKDKTWHLQYMKAFNKEFTTGSGQVLRWAYQEYAKWRLYARGKQPIDVYKEMLGVKKRHGKKDTSWRNLDWNILSIFPRFKRVIKNRLKKLPREILLSAIDAESIDQQNQRYAAIMEYMVNKEFHTDLAGQVNGYEPKVPFEDGEPTPENSEQIQMYMSMYPKNKYLTYMKDQIDMAFLQSDWKQMEDQILDDLIEVGIAGTDTYIDNIGRIRLRRLTPEQTICNACINNDYSDMIRRGYYDTPTLSELRASVPKGTFTEEDLAKIASKASGRDYSAVGAQTYFQTYNRYPWDHEKVTVLRAEWFSADDVAYVVSMNNAGNVSMSQRDNPDWLNKKGLTDVEYQSFYKSKGEERQIIRDTVNNVYHATWIVDTDYIFDYGRQSNMIRAINSINDCMLSTTMYTLDFDSYMRQCEPILDNIQVNWLQYQHQLAQSKPKGVAIERRAMGMVEVGGQKLSLQDILQMYAETGSFIYVGTDQNGRPYPFKPIEELLGGISEAAQGHMNFIIQQIDLLRGILGLNEVVDSSTPDPKTGKKVAEFAVENADNALGDLYHAFINIYEKTAKRVCMLVPDAELMGKSTGKQLALGADAHQYFLDNRNIGLMDFGLKVEASITTELRLRLTEHINASIKTPNNPSGILPEDAFLIENEDNLWRAYQLLAQKRRLREEEEYQREVGKMQEQAKGNTETAVAAEKEKQATMALEVQLYEKKANIDTMGKIAVVREENTWAIMLAKVTAGLELNADEQQIYADLLMQEMKIKGDLKKAEVIQKNKPKPKKAA